MNWKKPYLQDDNGNTSFFKEKLRYLASIFLPIPAAYPLQKEWDKLKLFENFTKQS